MGYEIEFGHREKPLKKERDMPVRYWFVIKQGCEECEHNIYFYTFGDLSAFNIQYAISDPTDFILLGTVIIAEKDFIRAEIKKHLKD